MPTTPSPTRARVLEHLADLVPDPVGDGCVRVGVDGPDGSGKTVLAAELAAWLRSRGRVVVEVSLDDFLRPAAERHARGRNSPEGFWLDSYDHAAVLERVLVPFGPGGSRVYRTRSLDHGTDRPVSDESRTAAPGTVLVVDGLFLHRRELEEHWDLSVYLDVPFEETCRRMAVRDGSDADPESEGMRRYVGGQRIYFRERTPWDRADVVVDNTDPDEPRLVTEDVHPDTDCHR